MAGVRFHSGSTAVIDLVRLVELSQRKGEYGAIPWLACFFKSPLAVAEQDFSKQFALLETWAAQQALAEHAGGPHDASQIVSR